MRKIGNVKRLTLLYLLIFRSFELLAVPEHIILDFDKLKIEEKKNSQIDEMQLLERWSEHSRDSSFSDSQDWPPSKSVGQRSRIIEYKFEILGISFIPFHFKNKKSYATLSRLIDRKLHGKDFDKVFIIIKNELKNGNEEFKNLVEEDGGDKIQLLEYSIEDISSENESIAMQRHSRRSILSIHNIDGILSRVEERTLLIYVDSVKWNLVNFRKRLDLTNSLREDEFEDDY